MKCAAKYNSRYISTLLGVLQEIQNKPEIWKDLKSYVLVQPDDLDEILQNIKNYMANNGISGIDMEAVKTLIGLQNNNPKILRMTVEKHLSFDGEQTNLSDFVDRIYGTVELHRKLVELQQYK